MEHVVGAVPRSTVDDWRDIDSQAILPWVVQTLRVDDPLCIARSDDWHQRAQMSMPRAALHHVPDFT